MMLDELTYAKEMLRRGGYTLFLCNEGKVTFSEERGIKPLLALAILLMCFPLNGLLWMGIAAVVGASLPLPRVLLADED